MTHNRRAFTLLEVLIALVIFGVIAGVFTRLLLSQSRSFGLQTAQRESRATARNSMNVLLAELRMVQDSGGVDSIATDGSAIRVRVPYRFGLVCGATAATITASMLPADTTVLAMATYSGYAYRDRSTQRYTYIMPANPLGVNAPISSVAPATCTGSGSGQANLATLTISGVAGQVVDLTPGATVAEASQPIFLWQEVTYAFGASSAYPGKVGLWRTAGTGTPEELMAPFDTTARFRIYRTGDDTSKTNIALTDTSNIRGLDIVLSAVAANRSSGPNPELESHLVTSVFFKNARSF